MVHGQPTVTTRNTAYKNCGMITLRSVIFDREVKACCGKHVITTCVTSYGMNDVIRR